MPGKKVPERYSGLCPSDKELQEQRSSVFRHKNTPGFINMLFKLPLCCQHYQ
jgi:hypothetical protein